MKKSLNRLSDQGSDVRKSDIIYDKSVPEILRTKSLLESSPTSQNNSNNGGNHKSRSKQNRKVKPVLNHSSSNMNTFKQYNTKVDKERTKTPEVECPVLSWPVTPPEPLIKVAEKQIEDDKVDTASSSSVESCHSSRSRGSSVSSGHNESEPKKENLLVNETNTGG